MPVFLEAAPTGGAVAACEAEREVKKGRHATTDRTRTTREQRSTRRELSICSTCTCTVSPPHKMIRSGRSKLHPERHELQRTATATGFLE